MYSTRSNIERQPFEDLTQLKLPLTASKAWKRQLIIPPTIFHKIWLDTTLFLSKGVLSHPDYTCVFHILCCIYFLRDYVVSSSSRWTAMRRTVEYSKFICEMQKNYWHWQNCVESGISKILMSTQFLVLGINVECRMDIYVDSFWVGYLGRNRQNWRKTFRSTILT